MCNVSPAIGREPTEPPEPMQPFTTHAGGREIDDDDASTSESKLTDVWESGERSGRTRKSGWPLASHTEKKVIRAINRCDFRHGTCRVAAVRSRDRPRPAGTWPDALMVLATKRMGHSQGKSSPPLRSTRPKALAQAQARRVGGLPLADYYETI
ncbi:hypothetical protein VTN77DRAFT_2338 [Rasamsonia byssochlamydoides]|uniref:uncharacterized protein n=1 Tax=Rasamsonia byssochlamydoides TaxID=89139 RepID=UPI0037441F6D